MGRRIQFYSRIIFLLFIGFSAFAQSSKIPKKTTDSITTVKDQYGFTRYSISPDKLAYFYVCQKNLGLINKELVDLQQAYDTVTVKNEKLEKNFKDQQDYLQNMKKLLTEEINACKSTVFSVDKDNSDLHNSNERLKKRQWRMYGLGVATPVVIIVVAVVVKTVLIK